MTFVDRWWKFDKQHPTVALIVAVFGPILAGSLLIFSLAYVLATVTS